MPACCAPPVGGQGSAKVGPICLWLLGPWLLGPGFLSPGLLSSGLWLLRPGPLRPGFLRPRLLFWHKVPGHRRLLRCAIRWDAAPVPVASRVAPCAAPPVVETGLQAAVDAVVTSSCRTLK